MADIQVYKNIIWFVSFPYFCHFPVAQSLPMSMAYILRVKTTKSKTCIIPMSVTFRNRMHSKHSMSKKFTLLHLERCDFGMYYSLLLSSIDSIILAVYFGNAILVKNLIFTKRSFCRRQYILALQIFCNSLECWSAACYLQ